MLGTTFHPDTVYKLNSVKPSKTEQTPTRVTSKQAKTNMLSPSTTKNLLKKMTQFEAHSNMKLTLTNEDGVYVYMGKTWQKYFFEAHKRNPG